MHVLMVKTSSLGDIVHAFPVAQYLKSKGAQVHWVAEEQNIDLIKAHPSVDRAIAVHTNSWRKGKGIARFFQFLSGIRETHYDVVFDLQGNTKSGLITSCAKSSEKVGFARDSVPELLNLLFTNRRFSLDSGSNIREDYLKLVASWFGEPLPKVMKPVLLRLSEEEKKLVTALTEKGKFKLMVCPGSAWKNKRVPNDILKNFLLKIDADLPCHFYFSWGTDEEKSLVDELSRYVSSSTVLPKLSFPVLQNVMNNMTRVIAPDSFPLHLAGTTSTSTFSIFGPSSSLKYAPIGESQKTIQGECPYGRIFEKRCPVLRSCPTGACIGAISAETLYKQFLAATCTVP